MPDDKRNVEAEPPPRHCLHHTVQVLIRPTAEQLVLALMVEAAEYWRLLLLPRSEGGCRDAEAAWRPIYSYAAAPPAAAAPRRP